MRRSCMLIMLLLSIRSSPSAVTWRYVLLSKPTMSSSGLVGRIATTSKPGANGRGGNLRLGLNKERNAVVRWIRVDVFQNGSVV